MSRRKRGPARVHDSSRMGGRVVEGTGLENQRRATYRGFESHPIRIFSTVEIDFFGLLHRGGPQKLEHPLYVAHRHILG